MYGVIDITTKSRVSALRLNIGTRSPITGNRCRQCSPGRLTSVESTPELLISLKIETLTPDQPLLPCREPAFEEAPERGLPRRPEEEGKADHEVKGCDVEADGLHHLP